MANGYNKIYARNYWVNNTPPAINEVNLNNLENGVNTLDDRVVTLDKTKLDQTTANTMVKDVTFDEPTGIFTVTKLNGTTFTIDTKLEKITTNWTYDKDSQQIVLTLDDGTKQYIDLSALITQYEFLDSDTITFVISAEGKVKAIIKNGSITGDMLEPNYLANVTVQASKAETSANASAQSASDSAYNAKLSQSYSIGGSGIRSEEETDNAKYYNEQASLSADSAAVSETNAKASETNAASSALLAETSKASAKTSETNAKVSETNAKTSETNAESSKMAAAVSETNAKASETNAKNSADLSESYAVGTDGTVRPNDNVDCAKYYYEQAKSISDGIKGGLLPHGTVAFADLPSLDSAGNGWMYNISDDFVTTSDFKEGAGLLFPAGSNVYKTVDGYWDILAGSPVVGVKGENETSYRRGYVNITVENLGALKTNGDASNTSATFTQASTRTNIASGEKLSTIFGKIMKWFSDLKAVAFSGSYNDLSDTPDYTDTFDYISERLTSHGDDIRWLRENKINYSDIVDDLESEDSFVPLSANMGRELAESIGEINNNLSNLGKYVKLGSFNSTGDNQTLSESYINFRYILVCASYYASHLPNYGQWFGPSLMADSSFEEIRFYTTNGVVSFRLHGLVYINISDMGQNAYVNVYGVY